MVRGLWRKHSAGRRLSGDCRKKCTSGCSLFLRALWLSYAHAKSDVYSNRESNADADCNTHSNLYTHGYANTDYHPVSNSNPHANANCEPATNSNSDRDSYADFHSHAHRELDTKNYSDAKIQAN